MSGCLSAILRRLGGSSASARRMGGASASLEQVGGMQAVCTKIGGMTSCVTKVSGMQCRLGLVCNTSVGIGYLYASDGLLLTIDNGRLIVKRAN